MEAPGEEVRVCRISGTSRGPATDRPLPKTLRLLGAVDAPRILCLAGFGDDSSMFTPLLVTELAQEYCLVVVDLPGFGDEPPFPDTFATISNLAGAVAEITRREGIEVILAHSVASVIACVAAQNPGSGVGTILSLEGNLTAADGFYTRLVEEHEHPETFHSAFLGKLNGPALQDPLIARYQARVAKAQSHALWSLGMDITALSDRLAPGQWLQDVERAFYLHNPENCAEESLAWLKTSGIPARVLDGTSHWPTIDAPELTSQVLLEVLPNT